MLWSLIVAAFAGTASPEIIRLDIGGQHSAVLDGFQRVSRDGGVGASWAIVPNVMSANVFPDALCDNATAGVLTVEGDGGWMAVRVSAFSPGPGGRRGSGLWTLKIDDRPAYQPDIPARIEDFLPSPHFMPVRRPVFREGESAWDRILKHQHPWIVVPVPAAGPVDVSVIGRTWEAVIRAPSETVLRSAMEQADAAARADYIAHADVTARPPLPVGGQGIEVANWGVLPDPAAAGAPSTWSMQGSRGEVLGGVVWVHGEQGTVQVEADDAAFIETALTEAVWYDSRGRPSRNARPQPSVLEEIDGELLGGQGMPVGLGVRLRIDPRAPTGRHRLQLRLSGTSGDYLVPVEIDVLPFELDPAIPTGPFVTMNLFHARWHGVGSPGSLAYIDRAMDMLAERGFTNIGLQNAMFGLGGTAVDLSVVTHVLDGWVARGGQWFHWTDVKRDLRNDAMYDNDTVVLSDNRLDRTGEMLRGISGRGIPVTVALTEEEGWKSAEAVRRAVDYSELVRTVTPADVWLTGHVGHALGWTLGPHWDVMTWSGHPAETWSYAQQATSGIPLVAYNFGAGRGGSLRAWHLDAVAHLEWQFADEPSDPFVGVEANRSVTFSVLGPDGLPWSTPWFERFAIGVADARYLRTLDRWTRELRCDAPVVEEARQWLDGVHEALELTRKREELAGDIWTEDAFDDVRRQTIGYLMRVGRRCGVISAQVAPASQQPTWRRADRP